jgi:hypothetical protein
MTVKIKMSVCLFGLYYARIYFPEEEEHMIETGYAVNKERPEDPGTSLPVSEGLKSKQPCPPP